MQPFGDRSNVVIEPMLTDQWFVDAKTLAEPAIASVREGHTNFVPKNWEKNLFRVDGKQSSPGASPASFGGATRFLLGTGRTGRFSSRRPRKRHWMPLSSITWRMKAPGRPGCRRSSRTSSPARS